MTKSKDGTSPAGEELLNATRDISGAEYSKVEYGYGEELQEDAKQRINELTKPIAAEKCRAIGAPAEDVVNASHGGLTTQLRDTTKSPNAINASAHAERLHLAKDARCLDLAADMAESIQPQNSMERTLSHQIAAMHALGMRLMDKAVIWLDDAKPVYSNPDKISASVEAVRLANAAARAMKVSQEAMLTLEKLRGGGQQQVTVVHQHVQVAGGNVAVAGHVNRGEANDAEGVTQKMEEQPHAKQVEYQPSDYAPMPSLPGTNEKGNTLSVTGHAQRQVPDARRAINRRSQRK